MTKEVSIFSDSPVPAFVKQARSSGGGNLIEKATPRNTVPTLAYGGKVFSVSLNGQTKKLEGRNADGDMVPLQVMRVVVLDYNARRGRRFYERDFDPAQKAMPRCWSDDGYKPHESVKEPICSTCQLCPKSAKNSKINPTTGKGTVACAEFRTVVVVPANELSFPALRLQLAVTSDWDNQSPDLLDQGWRAFQNYTEYLRAGDVPYSAMLVTKIRFDPNVNYPKLIFSKDRWLNDEEWGVVEPRITSDEVKTLLKGTWTPNGVDGEKLKAPEPPAAYKAPTPAKPSLDDDDYEAPPVTKRTTRVEVEEVEEVEEKPKRTRRTKAEMEAARAAEVEEVEEIEEAPPRKVATVTADDDDGLADLAARWKNRKS